MPKQDISWNKLFLHERQEFLFGDAIVVVENGVFTPDPNITYSTSVIVENLPSMEGLSVADIGTGSGILAILAALHGAKKVVATDVSDDAVKNTLTNASLNRVTEKIKVLKTNLFSDIEDKFDIIFANLPILDKVWLSKDINTEEVIESFLKQGKYFLNPLGEVYLPWASFGDKKHLEFLMKKYGYNFRFMSKEKLGCVWYLYILTVGVIPARGTPGVIPTE